ncbi:MAG: hypothetical protein HUU37_07275 [Bdellovibrionales bacterium]|nr:hypothetical protein [Bdellovibrionales bacterium]
MIFFGCGTKDSVEVSGAPSSVTMTENRLAEGGSSRGELSDWLLCSDGSVSYYFFRHDSDANSSGRSFLSRSASSEGVGVRHVAVVDKTGMRVTVALVGQKPDGAFLPVLSQVDFQRGKAEETVLGQFRAAPVPAEMEASSPMGFVSDRWLVWDDSQGATVRLARNPAEEAARWPADLGPYRNIRSSGLQVLWDTVRSGRAVTQFGLLNEKGEITFSRNLPPPLVDGTKPVDAQFLPDGSVAWLDWNRDWANLRLWKEGEVRSFRVLHGDDRPVLPFLAAVGPGRFAITDGREVRWLKLLDRTSEISLRREIPQEVADLVAKDARDFGIFGDGAQAYLRVPSRIGARISTMDEETGFRYMTPWACRSHALGKGAF